MGTGKTSRDKGQRGELEVRNILREFGFSKARRGQQYCGANGDADVVGLPGIHIEVKRTERFNLYDALAQAKADKRAGELPVVFHRKNRCEWVVVQPAEDWMQLFKDSYDGDLQVDIQDVETNKKHTQKYTLSCGHTVYGTKKPEYCSECGGIVR